jgi:hypothetical protein
MYQLFNYLWNYAVWFLLELEQMSINLLYIRYGIDVSEDKREEVLYEGEYIKFNAVVKQRATSVFNYLWNYIVWVLLELDEITKSAGDALHIFYGLDPLVRDDVIEEKDDKKVVIVVRYEDKYLTKFNALTKRATTVSVEPTTTSVDKRFVMDMTPVGNVIMQYNADKESFVYYSDNIIPFRYLETVSRKYVCMFDCKELFVERSEQKIQHINHAVSIKTKDLMNQKRNPLPVKEKAQFEVKMNRYSNAGRLSNFNMLQPVAKHITDKKRLMRFSEFKNTLLKKV